MSARVSAEDAGFWSPAASLGKHPLLRPGLWPVDTYLEMKTKRLNLATVLVGTSAMIAAATMVAIFATVLWRIATNAYGATGDFLAFYAAGYLVRGSHASHLYDPTTLAWAQRLLYPGDFDAAIGFPLPVFVAWLFAPFSALPFTFSFFLWMASSVVLLAALLRWFDTQLRRVPVLPRRAFLAFGAFAMPSLTTIVFGQVDFIALAGLTGGYLLLRKNRPALAGLPLCLVLVKPHFLVGAALFLLVRREWKTIGMLVAVGLPLLVVPAVLTAPETLVGNVKMLASYPGSGEELAVNASVMANWRGFISSATNSSDIRLWLPGLVAIAPAAVAIALSRWRAATTLADFDHAYSLAVMLPLLISPHLHTQNLVLMVLPGALMLRAYLEEDATENRQQTAINWMLFYFSALFFLPFFAMQGLSLTVFLIIGTYLAIAFRWPGHALERAIEDGRFAPAQAPRRAAYLPERGPGRSMVGAAPSRYLER